MVLDKQLASRTHIKDLRIRDIPALLIIFSIYTVTAYFGLQVSAINQFSALVWPPSGIAIAALLILGRRFWPAVFFGAFVVNAATGASWYVAFGIAIGNSLEAMCAVWVCSYGNGFDNSLEKFSHVLKLVLGALLSPVIAASIGIASLWLGGLLDLSQIVETGMQWWTGDTIGALAVTPLLLTFSRQTAQQRRQWIRTGWLEKSAFALILIGVSWLVLSSSAYIIPVIGFKGVYIVVPVVLWGAMRFGLRGSTMAVFVISLCAVWNTAHNLGPFVDDVFFANILHVLIFVITMSTTGLFVGSVVTELNAAKEAAESGDLAKSAFLANMSHEIRTPLTAVIGFAELIADPQTSETQKVKYVDSIRRSGEVLSNLINDILELAKLEAGKMQISEDRIVVEDLIYDLKMMLGRSATDKGIELRFSIASNVPKAIVTDIVRLRQILINIIGNAVKFTSKGFVDVHVELVGHRLSFTVKDTGIGIRANDSQFLFASFSQGDSSLKRKYGGTGLGLALSRRLARVLGGDVVLAESAEEKGSTFVITISAGDYKKTSVERTSSASKESLSHNESTLNNIRVLLAEDSVENQILVKHLLRIAGAEVDVANNGKEAVEKAQAQNYNVVLMDLQMPVMNGYEATQQLRTEGYVGPIVALTAHALESERQRCLASGFDEHVIKPINREALIRRVSELATLKVMEVPLS